MPKLPSNRNPKHFRHKSRQGVVYLSGQAHYTGVFGTEQSDRKYQELIGLWHLGGRKPLKKPKARALTVAELARQYAEFADGRFRKRGSPTSHAVSIAHAMERLALLYPGTAATEFGADEFEVVRESWLNEEKNQYDRPNSVRTVNAYAEHVRGAFLWAHRKRRLIPFADWMNTKSVPRLKAKDNPERRRPKVRAASIESVRTFFECPTVRKVIRDMIVLQLTSGMRPGEVCGMRSCDVDRSADPWVYRVSPEFNKNDHHEQERVVRLGPRARAVLTPYLEGAPTPKSFLFHTRTGTRYTTSAYGVIVAYNCKRLGIEKWTPNQLRHLRLTEIRRTHGLESASAVGGHSEMNTTLIYAERDETLAAKAAEETG